MQEVEVGLMGPNRPLQAAQMRGIRTTSRLVARGTGNGCGHKVRLTYRLPPPWNVHIADLCPSGQPHIHTGRIQLNYNHGCHNGT
jgi:hypothetical protein